MAKEKKVEQITDMEVDFAQWYTDVCKKAELIDYSSIKGMFIYRPYGYAIWENIQRLMDAEFKKTGAENVYMPMLIPESLLQKEKDHVEGFAPECAWVTMGGSEKLEERYCIRPTSETLFCEHFHDIIHSWRDLPKMYNQWCSVLRWEKTSRPFLRHREFLWQEGHTMHATAEEAREETERMLNVYADFCENVLAMPVTRGQKTDKEKFNGAEATYTIECMMHDRKALQAGTSHFFGDGCYDAAMAAGGTIFLLEDHLDRFYASARLLDIHIPMEKQALGELLTQLARQVEGESCFVYWQVSRGVEPRSHTYAENLPGKLWVLVRPQVIPNPNIPIRLNDEEDTRFFHCNIKSLNLLCNVMTAQRAHRAGCTETVFHRGEIVTECAHSNISVLKDGVLYSHPNDEFILRGIAKSHMIRVCYRLDIPVLEKPFTMDFLKSADEILVTSTTKFCLSADTLNGQSVGGKDPAVRIAIQNAVMQDFRDCTGYAGQWN